MKYVVLKILIARVVGTLAVTGLHIHVIIANWSTKKFSTRRKTGKNTHEYQLK